MRRFELIEGSSRKFWEIALDGASFEVRWGRIGTSGQSQTKTFPSEAKALAEHDKLVKEKTSKGYVEVAGGATAPAPAAKAPKAAKAEEAKPAPAPVEEPKAEIASAPRGFVLTDPRTWPERERARVFVQRGVPARPIAVDRAALWAKIDAHLAERDPKRALARTLFARLEEAEKANVTPSPDLAAQLVHAIVSLAPGHDQQRWVDDGVALVVDHWIASGGLAHAVRCLRALGDDDGKAPSGRVTRALYVRASAHLAAADEATYAEARAAARLDALPPPGSRSGLREGLAFLFPESGIADAEVIAVAKARAAGAYAYVEPLLAAAVSTPAGLEALATFATGYTLSVSTLTRTHADAEPTLLTLIARFGEAALPAFEAMLSMKEQDAETQRAVAQAIAFLGTTAAFEKLAARAGNRAVVAALREGAMASPVAALPALVKQVQGRGAAASPCRSILAQLLGASSPELARAEEALGEAGKKLLAEIRAAGGADREEATEAELPKVLVAPPWLGGKKKAAAATVEGLAILPFVESMAWPDEATKAEWGRIEPVPYYRDRIQTPNHYMERWGVPRALAEKLAERDDEGDLRALAEHAAERMKRYFYADAWDLTVCPPRLAGKLLAAFAPAPWWSAEDPLRSLAARHELTMLPAFLRWAASHLEAGLALLRPYRSPRVAMLAADAYHRLKKKPASARAWLLAHPEAAVIGLVPTAIGKPGKARDAAESALRLLAREGHEALVMEVAARYGEAAKAATRAVLDFDPLDIYPGKIPSVPDFVEAAALPRIVLAASGKALPAAAARHVLTMLAISKIGEPYAGLAVVKSIATPASLASFAWELFQSWLVAGAPSKEGWAFTALAHLGDDECARKLTPLVRAWPGESQHARSVTGLDVLAAIGTDVALMHLNGIAQKLKFKGLQEKAREKIDEIAEARGLSAEELADRLVPDLGLDDDGSLTLDFGPRAFRVVFDETLKPLVKDADGKRLADLPKPRKDDDAEKAAAATETWKALKKDAKTIAQQQVLRLELGMCFQRRWDEAVFRRFLVEHPLLRHLVVRLAWGAYDAEDRLLAAFRVAEDGTYADVNDEAWTLPAGAKVGVVHALEASAEDQAKLGQLFGDYELLQPFPQIGRETFRLTDEELKSGVVDRWSSKQIPTGKVLGLEARGWRRGTPGDGGNIGSMEKHLAEEVVVTIELDPGIAVGMLDLFPEQKIVGLGMGFDWRWRKNDRATLAAVHPVAMSEILRDLTLMVS